MPLIVLLKLVLTEHYKSLSCTVHIIFRVILDFMFHGNKGIKLNSLYIYTEGNFSN